MSSQIQHYYTLTHQQDKRFQRILMVSMLICSLVGLIVPFIKLPEIEREELEKLPPRLARVVLEKKKTTPPPKKVVKPEPKPKLEEPKSTVAKQQPKPAPKPKAVAQKAPPKKAAKKPSKLAREKARQKAAQSGLMAMKSNLSSLKSSFDLGKIKKGSKLAKSASSNAASQTGINPSLKEVVGSSALQRERANNATTAEYEASNVQLAALSAQTVNSDLIGKVDNNQSTLNSQQIAQATQTRGKPKGDGSQRNEGAIRAHFDNNKGAIFALYNRALRKNPLLQGKVVISLTIEPNGAVSDCKILNTELDDPKLERKLVTRVKMINFGAANVKRMTMEYAFDFLPT